MSTLIESVRTASATLDDIIDRVCAKCGNSCCHQGTMMGSRDLLRLHKGVVLEEGRGEILLAGLRRRSAELRTDLEAIEEVAERLSAAREQLDRRLEDWRTFCDFLDAGFEITMDNLSYLLRFSAIRSNALRALRELPNGQQIMQKLAASGASFRLSGRRVAAPRCLFHVDGCLAGVWKPTKCANFFCTSEPNVLREIARGMNFEQFVLGNFRLASAQQVLRAIEIEPELGREYVAPKIVTGASQDLTEKVVSALGQTFKFVETRRTPGPFMLSTTEAHTLLDALPEAMAYVRVCPSVDGGALYELAVALDRLRIAGKSLPFYLFVGEISPPTVLTHPLWTDGVMSQPLGALEMYAVE